MKGHWGWALLVMEREAQGMNGGGLGRLGRRGQPGPALPLSWGWHQLASSPHFVHGSPAKLHRETWGRSSSSWTRH